MFWIGVVLIVIMILIILINFNKRPIKERSPIRAKAVLTMNEQPTFLRLKQALPEYHILAQVAFSGFMTAKGYTTRNLFNRKVADFVVLDKNFKCVVIIELDDASHNNKKDQDAKRDEMIKEAGLRVIRYKNTPQIQTIREDVLNIEKN